MTLKEHTVKSYDKDLGAVSQNLDEMVRMIIQSIDMILQLIDDEKADFLQEISIHDAKINQLDHLTEKRVTAILAMRQPMAVDLRYTVSAIKVSANLERAADQAKNIVKKLSTMQPRYFTPEVKQSFLAMLEMAKKMIPNSVKAFNDHDVELADRILNEDQKVDDIYRSLFGILKQDNFNEQEVRDAVRTLFIAKSFERLADHTVNICEMAKYVVTGEIVD